MADNTPKPEEVKPATETKPVETKPAEETKAEETKPEPKPASSASANDEVPDINLTDEYKTNEENEEILHNVRAKLYRFHVATKEWRERGTGQVRLLKHKESGRIRFLMRRDKTFKICGNHYITPTMDLQVNKNNDKSWIWDCPADYSEDPTKPSQDVYAIRFMTADETKAFKEVWASAQAQMKALLAK
jgi:Ran-binding protein 1